MSKTIILSWFSAGACNVVGKTNVPENKLFIFYVLYKLPSFSMHTKL